MESGVYDICQVAGICIMIYLIEQDAAIATQLTAKH